MNQSDIICTYSSQLNKEDSNFFIIQPTTSFETVKNYFNHQYQNQDYKLLCGNKTIDSVEAFQSVIEEANNSGNQISFLIVSKGSIPILRSNTSWDDHLTQHHDKPEDFAKERQINFVKQKISDIEKEVNDQSDSSDATFHDQNLDSDSKKVKKANFIHEGGALPASSSDNSFKNERQSNFLQQKISETEIKLPKIDFSKERQENFQNQKIANLNFAQSPKQDHFSRERQENFQNQKAANFSAISNLSNSFPESPTLDRFSKERQENFQNQKVANFSAIQNPSNSFQSPTFDHFSKERQENFQNQKVANFSAVPNPANSLQSPTFDHFSKERQENFQNQKVANFSAIPSANSIQSPKQDHFSKERQENFQNQKVNNFAGILNPSNSFPSPTFDHFSKERQENFQNQKVANFSAVPNPANSLQSPTFDRFSEERQENFQNQKVTNFSAFSNSFQSPTFSKERQENFQNQKVANLAGISLQNDKEIKTDRSKIVERRNDLLQGKINEMQKEAKSKEAKKQKTKRVEEYLLNKAAIKKQRKNSHSAICDNCRTQIHGIRYKCLECLDFDLCEPCDKLNDITKFHEHVFCKLNSPSQLQYVQRLISVSNSVSTPERSRKLEKLEQLEQQIKSMQEQLDLLKHFD